MKLVFAGLSEAGSRQENQDCIYCASSGSEGVFLVADGMGGHENGAFASRLIRKNVAETWEKHRKLEKHPQETEISYAEALRKANASLRASAPEGTVCGSTAVVLSLMQDHFELTCSGDSHAYLVTGAFPGSRVRLLSIDDVWENEPSNVRGMGKSEICSHRNFGRLIRAVGTQQNFTCHCLRGMAVPGSLFVLVSDGIYKYIDPKLLEKELKRARQTAHRCGNEALMEHAENLQKLVYEAGAPDNFSVILVYLGKG